MIPEGLSLEENIISIEKELELIQWLDKKTWSNALSRRTQHYGYEYNYKGGSLTLAPPLEGPILELAKKIELAELMKPNQCIVNEYYYNQGIAPHIDSLSFGPTIIGISIGADASMTFQKGLESFECFLPRRSMLMLKGDARYKWKHSLNKKSSYINSEGVVIKKPLEYRRISLTFREVPI